MNAAELRQLTGEISAAGSRCPQVSSEAAEKLFEYALLLSRWTQKMDLVSSPDLERIIHEHILDSVGAFNALLHQGPLSRPIIDIGSGAGLPGVVFSILAPTLSVTLIEPRAKRVNFLLETRRALELPYSVIGKRLQEIPAKELPGTSLHGVQRAVGLEVENRSYLSGCTSGSVLSTLVSVTWSPPAEISAQLLLATQYECPQRRGQVVTFQC